MTTIDIPNPTRAMPSALTRARDVLTSEWTKLRSVRSTFWTLLIAAVTALGGSLILAFASAGTAKQPFDPIASIYLAWLEYPVLAIGVLGVLSFTSEFSTGQIRVTFTAVPRRLTVLAAKASVVGGVALVLGETLSFIAFFLSEAILSVHHRGISLAHPGALRAVVAAGVSLCAVTVLGVALGSIIRHTAGGVVALPALIYLPLVLLSLPAPWGDRIGRFTLLLASYQLVSLHSQSGLFSPVLSALVLLAWPAAGLLVAAGLIARDT
jgi:ABC-2 type transport system permease protein